MESIGDIIKKRAAVRGNFEQLVEETMKDKAVQAFIAQHKMSADEIQRSYSKFYEFVKERAKFEQGAKMAADGYEPVLIMNHGYADVSYQTTAELAARQANQNLRRRVQMIGLPQSLKEVNWDAIMLDDTRRIAPYQALSDFIAAPTERKGLYLYGDFGVGKSFMMAALANELAKKALSTTLIHYPSFTADLDFNNVKLRVNEVKAAEVLVLDDIGAEMNNAWLRDAVLQVILQHRMQENLPTFFTSNLTMQELEQHLAETKKVEDIWPAKRVMERVKYLADEMRLEGVNRRHD